MTGRQEGRGGVSPALPLTTAWNVVRPPKKPRVSVHLEGLLSQQRSVYNMIQCSKSKSNEKVCYYMIMRAPREVCGGCTSDYEQELPESGDALQGEVKRRIKSREVGRGDDKQKGKKAS